MAFRPADWPLTCPDGHEIRPGHSHYGGWTLCFEPCGGKAHGHHPVVCGTCKAQLLIGHEPAEWELRDGTRRPA